MQEQLQQSQQQNALESQYLQFAQQRFNQGDILQQPLISKLQSLTSGDPNAVISAAGPELGNIAKSGQAAKANIFNTIPAGAARDFALSQVPMQQYSQTAGYLNNIINQAPQELAQIGSAQQGLGTTLTGAAQGFGTLGTSQAGLAGTTAYNQQQIAAQQKASTLGFIGSLAGATGSAFSGTKLFG